MLAAIRERIANAAGRVASQAAWKVAEEENWRARQDSNLRPLPSEGQGAIGNRLFLKDLEGVRRFSEWQKMLVVVRHMKCDIRV